MHQILWKFKDCLIEQSMTVDTWKSACSIFQEFRDNSQIDWVELRSSSHANLRYFNTYEVGND